MTLFGTPSPLYSGTGAGGPYISRPPDCGAAPYSITPSITASIASLEAALGVTRQTD